MSRQKLFSLFLASLSSTCMIVATPALAGPTQSPTATPTATPTGLALVAHWDFNEGSGSTLGDSSGNNNHGTLTNNPTWTTGRFGTALHFDGVDDHVIVPTSASLGLSSSYTIIAWVAFDTLPSLSHLYSILGKKGPPGALRTNYLLGYDNRVLNPSGSYSAGAALSHSSITTFSVHPVTLATEQWYLIAAVFDDAADTLEVYIDGILVNSVGVAGIPVTNSDDLYIGVSNQLTPLPREGTFKGKIDEVSIYNIALSAEEILGFLVPASPTATPTATPTPIPLKKVTMCHKGKHSISASANAVPAHLAHGDTLGACP